MMQSRGLGRICGMGAVFASLLFTACGSDESGPSSVMVKEIEITTEQGGDTSIERIVAAYETSYLRDVSHFDNGEDAGRHEFLYEGAKVSQIISFDTEGDRATTTWEYDKGVMSRRAFEIPESYSTRDTFEYDGGLPKEISSTRTQAGSTSSSNLYERFEYDGGNLSKATRVQNSDQSSVSEFRYDNDNNLERLQEYTEGRLTNSYEYSYDGSKVDEVLDKDNNRYDISYDSNDRIEVIRYVAASGMRITTRYTYQEGSVTGLSLAPSLPGFFDLNGHSFTVPVFEHMAPVRPGNYPTPSGTSEPDEGNGGSDGGSSGGSEEICGEVPENSCHECSLSSCCPEINDCDNSVSCIDFYNCVLNCNGEQSCVNSCFSEYPNGSQLFVSFQECQSNRCSSACN